MAGLKYSPYDFLNLFLEGWHDENGHIYASPMASFRLLEDKISLTMLYKYNVSLGTGFTSLIGSFEIHENLTFRTTISNNSNVSEKGRFNIGMSFSTSW